MSSTRITYSQCPDAKPEQERSVLAAVYKLCLERSHVRERGRLLDKSCPHDAILRNTKGGSHVEQRPG